MMSNFDRILSSEDVMRRRATLLQRLHIDGPLLILLLTLRFAPRGLLPEVRAEGR